MNQEDLDQKLVKLCFNRDLSGIKELIDQGANIHQTDDYVLRYACGLGYLDVIELLVNNGANIDARNNDPIKWAASNGHLDVIKFLINKGSKINDDDIDESPLSYACGEDGTMETIRYLVRSGAKYKNIFSVKNKIVRNYLDNKAPIDYSLGLNYDYNKPRKQQIIDAIKKNPSIINDLPKEEIEKIPNIKYLTKSDEYGLFERKVKNFNQWKSISLIYKNIIF